MRLPNIDEEKSEIQRFYDGQTVLITGGTGFLGKVLVQKLLRECPDIEAVYLIIRMKKDVECEDRIKKILDEPLFDELKRVLPNYREKIVVLAGDCSLPNLGLSPKDIETVKSKVSIVFNGAATVRFDEDLKKAVCINVRGTREIFKLAAKMPHLKAVVHVSTAYSNCLQSKIAEKLYASPMTGDELIEYVHAADENKININTKKVLGDFPNTYAFTKQVAEQVVQQYGQGLPCGIFRPAVVISSYTDPVRGWVDNVFGATGAMVGGGAGLVRTLYVDPECTAELVPVDLTVNALISTAWDVARSKSTAEPNVEYPKIYNYASTWDEPLTWGKYMDLAFKYGNMKPSKKAFWCYSLTCTKFYWMYYILSFFLHSVPGATVDFAAKIFSPQKIQLMRIYKRIHKFADVTAFFATRKWDFDLSNTKALWSRLSEQDRRMFGFSMYKFDWEDYMNNCVDGMRLYIFKEGPETIPDAKKRMARFQMIHNGVKATFLSALTAAIYYFVTTSVMFQSQLSRFRESISIR
ncbi:hypothetical protein TKK_0006260 [Trichogramma kaykai]